MTWWQVAGRVLQDVGGTGFGAWVIYHEVYAANPNNWVLLVGFGCMFPAARYAVMAILSGPGSSSESPPRSGEPPSPPSQSGGTGERG